MNQQLIVSRNGQLVSCSVDESDLTGLGVDLARMAVIALLVTVATAN